MRKLLVGILWLALVVPAGAGELAGIAREELQFIPPDPLCAVAVKVAPLTAYCMIKGKVKAWIPYSEKISETKKRLKTATGLKTVEDVVSNDGPVVCFWVLNRVSLEYVTWTMTLSKNWEMWLVRQLEQCGLEKVRVHKDIHGYALMMPAWKPYCCGITPYITVAENHLILTTSRGQMKSVLRQIQKIRTETMPSLGDNETVAALYQNSIPGWFFYFNTPAAIATFYPFLEMSVDSLVIAYNERYPWLKQLHACFPRTQTLLQVSTPLVKFAK